jgi:hypothetical protein
LLKLAAQHFDVFVTVDRNLSFQQNLGAYPLGVIVLQAETNRLSDLQRLLPALLRAIPFAQPGTPLFVGRD